MAAHGKESRMAPEVESGRLCSVAGSRQPRPSAPAGLSRSSRLSGSLVSQNYEYFHLEGAGGSPSKNGILGRAGPHGSDGEVRCSGLTLLRASPLEVQTRVAASIQHEESAGMHEAMYRRQRQARVSADGLVSKQRAEPSR
ncbi:hypothetical protein E2C01_075642 [Portunus trituberculatus]|uniref:Uncharacterized protein n=1 Tax=Portunus trituberculatus TaxID=210409 RepID=A0A5B7I6L6_PORTR|nr:hypothetical protein [Portunus trituberculatus]